MSERTNRQLRARRCANCPPAPQSRPQESGSSIWGLTPADPWRLRQARRHFVEKSADDFVKEGRDFVDRSTGKHYRMERSDPTLGEDPGSRASRCSSRRWLDRLPQAGRCRGSQQVERDRMRPRGAAV